MYHATAESDDEEISEELNLSTVGAWGVGILSVQYVWNGEVTMGGKDLNLKNIPCVSLPSSSAIWKSSQQKLKKDKNSSNIKKLFELRPETATQAFRTNSVELKILTQEGLSNKVTNITRRYACYTKFGVFCYEEEKSNDTCVKLLRKYDQFGLVESSFVAPHDIYRISSNYNSNNVLVMDSGGCLYLYDDCLKLFHTRDLLQEKYVIRHQDEALADNIDYFGSFRSQVRAVDVSNDGKRYLFTMADEIWCCNDEGILIWNLRNPLECGYVRGIKRLPWEDSGVDWIYSASFHGSGSVFVGTYSGLVVEVDQSGNSICSYGLGSTPRQILCYEDYSYFCTERGIYIVNNHKLVDMLDITSREKLIISDTAVLLHSDKRVRFYRHCGELIGDISTRDPIRAVYGSRGNFVVATKRQQATIRIS